MSGKKKKKKKKKKKTTTTTTTTPTTTITFTRGWGWPYDSILNQVEKEYPEAGHFAMDGNFSPLFIPSKKKKLSGPEIAQW